MRQSGVTKKITYLERKNIEIPGNLSDAQVYWPLNASQADALAKLNPFAIDRSATDLLYEKSRFAEVFAVFHRGLQFPTVNELMFTYSASNAMELVLNQLRCEGASSVQLLHPTFDATFYAARRHNLCPMPIDEDKAFAGINPWLGDAPPDALILTIPNNPTGRTISAESFASLCSACASQGVKLVLDCCFRVYEHQAVDHYSIINSTGVTAAVIEDTGKLFNVLDIKLGILWATPHWRAAISEVHKDFILEAPLLHLLVLRHLMEADLRYGEALRARVAANRKLANDALVPRGFTQIGVQDSAVQLYRVDGCVSAAQLAATTRDMGVGIVEADGFFWNLDSADAYIRIALARPTQVFKALLNTLMEAIDQLHPKG